MFARPCERLFALTLVLVAIGGAGCAHGAKLAAAPAEPVTKPAVHGAAPPVAAQATPTPGGVSPSPPMAASYEDAFFDFDQSALRTDARQALDEDAQQLRRHAKATVEIEGNCDERGTIEYNLALGERRAQAAKAYLENSGVSASRIKTISYGKEHPFDPGHNEAAWAKNRRDHVDVKTGPA